MNPVPELFDRMDDWRHLPDYQLERRADIFFALYLPEVLEVKFGFPFRPELVPEFPVRIGVVDPGSQSHMSYKIDYVALSAKGDRVAFIELKTDKASIGVEQKKNLQNAQEAGFHRLLEGVLEIFRETKYKKKYFYLFRHLESMRLLQIPEEVKTIMSHFSLRGIKEASHSIRIIAPPVKTKLVYVQPLVCVQQKENDKKEFDIEIITFKEFAATVRKHEDPVSQRFAKSLDEWAKTEPGEKVLE